MAGVTVSYYEQKRELPGVKEVRPEYREIGSQVLQDVIQRVEWAVAAFFRRCKAGEKPGYPRFKGHDRYDSFTYSQAGWKLDDGRLVLAGIGALRVRWSRTIQGTIKTVTIHRSADQWYVCFSCLLEVPPPAPPDRPATAIDVGLEYFATLADGITAIPTTAQERALWAPLAFAHSLAAGLTLHLRENGARAPTSHRPSDRDGHRLA